MQSEKKIKTIQEEISFCHDIGTREGMTFSRSVSLGFEETKNKRKMLENARNVFCYNLKCAKMGTDIRRLVSPHFCEHFRS